MIYDPLLVIQRLSVPKNVPPKDCDRKNVLFPPGAFIGCCPNRCSSKLPLLVGDMVVLRGPSGSSKSLGLLLKEGEVQPGFLALQTLGHTVRDRVFPEADDWDAGSLDQPLSQELGSTCCDLVLLQVHSLQLPHLWQDLGQLSSHLITKVIPGQQEFFQGWAECEVGGKVLGSLVFNLAGHQVDLFKQWEPLGEMWDTSSQVILCQADLFYVWALLQGLGQAQGPLWTQMAGCQAQDPELWGKSLSQLQGCGIPQSVVAQYDLLQVLEMGERLDQLHSPSRANPVP